jgi:hypothetical protein
LVVDFITCLPFIWLLFVNFQKGSGGTSENSEKMLDSRMQISFIACRYPTLFNAFSFSKKAVDSLWKGSIHYLLQASYGNLKVN